MGMYYNKLGHVICVIHQPHKAPTPVHDHQITDYEHLIPLTLALYNATHLSPSSKL